MPQSKSTVTTADEQAYNSLFLGILLILLLFIYPPWAILLGIVLLLFRLLKR